MIYQSIATLDNPEFINLQPSDINPFMSKCQIKVLYTGANRNNSIITKEAAQKMAKTLRGAPIVGYYRKDIEDFGDHGRQIIIEDGEIKFNCKTQPYGFVAPDAEVWFQKFGEQDTDGSTIIREYLMTTGYLWTGQYEECQQVTEDGGRPQSMELDEETLKGEWSHYSNPDMDFFIINDAIISKLCILGEQTEPCFQGSSVTPLEENTQFSLHENLLYNLMQQIQFALQGGKKMAIPANADIQHKEAENAQPDVKDAVIDNAGTDFSKEPEKDEKDKDKNDKSGSDEKDNNKEEEKTSNASKDEDKDEKKSSKKDYSLEEKFEQLSADFAALNQECQELRDFKRNIEIEKKTQLIESFYMLSDEDKKDVTEHITEYSLDDIEAKLSVICVRKKVSFDLEDTHEEPSGEESKAPVTYSLDDDGSSSSIPAWVSAAMKVRDSE